MTRWVLAVALWAVSAWAVTPGGSLYAASDDVVVRDGPSAKGKVLLTLKRGDELKWLGPSDKDKSFHLVERDGKKGFVHVGDLAPAKAQLEVSDTPQPGKPVPFAQSGAATTSPSWTSKEDGEAKRTLEALEALNAAAATPEALARKKKELGLR